LIRPAYVVERFPERSQTFVQNELRALPGVGVSPRVFALYPHSDLDGEASDLAFRRLPTSTHHLGRLFRAVSRLAVRRPRGLARAAVLAARRPSKFQIHCLAKAVFLAEELLADPPPWLHAHFARASASTSMLASAILAVPFTFTAHGADLFYEPFDVDRKIHRAAVTVTVCQYNRRWMQARWTAPDVIVVPCGVDHRRFTRSSPYPGVVPFNILAVGRLVPKKGFSDLVAACSILRDRGVAFNCVIAGGGPLEATLRTQIDSNHLGDRVQLLSSIPGHKIKVLLESASVFCLPAVVASDGDRDSQPVVLKEAMAMSVPVVATNEVGIPELVDAAVGVLVPPGDQMALADALGALEGSQNAVLAQLGRTGRARILDGFTLETQVMRLTAAWRSAGLYPDQPNV